MDNPFPRSNSKRNLLTLNSSIPSSSITLEIEKKKRKIEIIKEKEKKRKFISIERNERNEKNEIESLKLLNGLGNIKKIEKILNFKQNNKKITLFSFIILNLRSYLIGVQSYGYIIQINDSYLTVTLSGGVIAMIPKEEISDIFYKQFHHLDNQVITYLFTFSLISSHSSFSSLLSL